MTPDKWYKSFRLYAGILAISGVLLKSFFNIDFSSEQQTSMAQQMSMMVSYAVPLISGLLSLWSKYREWKKLNVPQRPGAAAQGKMAYIGGTGMFAALVIAGILFLSACSDAVMTIEKAPNTTTTTTTSVLQCAYATDCPECSEKQLCELSEYLCNLDTRFQMIYSATTHEKECYEAFRSNISRRLSEIQCEKFRKKYLQTINKIEREKQ